MIGITAPNRGRYLHRRAVDLAGPGRAAVGELVVQHIETVEGDGQNPCGAEAILIRALVGCQVAVVHQLAY